MAQLALSDSFEYLCYGFPAIRNILILTVRGSTLVLESDVYRRQILTTKVYPRAVRGKSIYSFNIFGFNITHEAVVGLIMT